MKKKLFLLLLCASFVLPAHAVFNENNISRTISVLRHELHSTLEDKNRQDIRHEKSSHMEEVHQRDMLSVVKWINELTLILYSQQNDFTLNQAYAADCVIYEYEKFNRNKRPKFTDIGVIDAQTERYERLIDALRMLPPQLGGGGVEGESTIVDSLLTNLPLLIDSAGSIEESEEKVSLLKELATYARNARMEKVDEDDRRIFALPEEAQADRDSCIAYAEAIVQSYARQKEKIKQDENYFNEVKNKLQQTYEYACACIDEIKSNIFVAGQENYFYVLSNLKKYVQDAFSDMEQQFGTGDSEQDWDGLHKSQWRWIFLVSTILYSLSHLILITLVVILLSCVILKNVKPFNTEWFRQTRPAVILLTIAVIYSLLIVISGLIFPMSNFVYVAALRILIYLWLVIALLLSLLVSMKNEDVRDGLNAFLPVLVLGLLLVMFRALFLPDKMIHLILSPVLLVFLLWQIRLTMMFGSRHSEYKNLITLQSVTSIVFGLAFLSALKGFSLLSLMLLMWWIFQGAALATLATIRYVLKYYESNGLLKIKEKYAASHKMISKENDGDFIRVTWLFDLIYRAVLPVACILSVFGCIWLALGVFNLSEITRTVFYQTFIDFSNTKGEPVLQVSISKLASVFASFFIYRYLNYLVRSLYRTMKFEKMMKIKGKLILSKNDVNLSLGNNVIGVVIWGLFVIFSINVLKIPMGAVSIIAAGLATGVGLALKDVLNNFIYGIQLMSGRLRVGDILECDGIRGTVEKISYQSTEIQTITGAVISFTNAALFNKNFQNLTKNSPYEYVGITISISYGEDVEKVRTLVSDSLKEYGSGRDKYGRYIVEQKRGIWLTFGNFGESSVDLVIKQFVLVESRDSYIAEVKEHVYKLFNDNNIVIPFPQREVSILNYREKSDE